MSAIVTSEDVFLLYEFSPIIINGCTTRTGCTVLISNTRIYCKWQCGHHCTGAMLKHRWETTAASANRFYVPLIVGSTAFAVLNHFCLYFTLLSMPFPFLWFSFRHDLKLRKIHNRWMKCMFFQLHYSIQSICFHLSMNVKLKDNDWIHFYFLTVMFVHKGLCNFASRVTWYEIIHGRKENDEQQWLLIVLSHETKGQKRDSILAFVIMTTLR